MKDKVANGVKKNHHLIISGNLQVKHVFFFNHLVVKSLSIHSRNQQDGTNTTNATTCFLPSCSRGGKKPLVYDSETTEKWLHLCVMIFTHPSAASKSQDALEINLAARTHD